MRGAVVALLAAAVLAGHPSVTRAEPATDDRPHHPEPRVIIDATAKREADARSIQAAARRGFWGKAVGCYRPALAEDADLVIDAAFEVEVRDGTVRRATARRRGGKRGGSARPRPASVVAACIAKRLVGLAMPDGVRATATIRVRMAPGDPPR